MSYRLRGMIKPLAIVFGLLAAARLMAGGLQEKNASIGRTITTNSASAPSPNPLPGRGHSDKRPSSIRSVDFRDAPEAQALAERARQIGNDVYPQILALLDDGKSELPQQLDIVFLEHVGRPRFDAGEEPWGVACRKTAFLNAGWLCDHPEDLDPVLVHEMAHVAQNYPLLAYRHAWQSYAHYFAFKAAHPFRPYPADEPSYWTEGMADYVCAKLGHTNISNCPQCNARYPRYTTGYGCAAAFLLYLDDAYGPNVSRQLNAVLRRGTYADRFFAEATGKPLDELWSDFQTTGAYTPIAAEYNELDQALGYIKGKPPKDLPLRLEKYFAKHPDIQDYITAVDPWREMPPEDLREEITDFIYIRQQPEGEQSLLAAKADLKELHQALGYANGKPPQDFRARLLAYLNAHPDTKEFAEEHGWLEGKPSPKIQEWVRSVILGRIQPGAKTTIAAAEFLYQLKKQGRLPGWRESEHGTLMLKTQGMDAETYPVDRTFACRKNSSRNIDIYTAVKASVDGGWELERAWETTAKGRFVKEFPIAIGKAVP
jgi:hypothetical protein